MPEKYSHFEFHYASFDLVAYSKEESSSSNLLKNLIKKLNSEDFPNEERIDDRYKHRKGNTKRRLVHISSTFGKKGTRCFGKMALIKNKAPMIWSGKDVIEEIDKPQNKQFIEVTNYIIDFNSKHCPIIMIEFNSSGPRLSDIEYFFRQVACKYRIAKSIYTKFHLNLEYNDLDKQIDNVFDVTVKVNATNTKDGNWHNSLKNLQEESGFRDVRFEIFYERKLAANGSYLKNIKGLDFVRGIIGWLKKDEKNIESVDDLKMTYQLNGSEEIVSLDFIKNKTTSYLSIPNIDGDKYSHIQFKETTGQEFNYYLEHGKPLNNTHLSI